MLGPEGITRGVYLHAEASLPERLAMLRTRYGINEKALPDFQYVYPTEVQALSIERFPALAVVVTNTTGQLGNRQTDLDAMGEEYSYRYTVQLYSYVVDDDEAATSMNMLRYTLAVREAFLANKILPVEDPHHATIDPKTLQESYSEVTGRETKFLAGSFVQFEVVSHEWLEAPASAFDTPPTIELASSLAVANHPYFDQ